MVRDLCLLCFVLKGMQTLHTTVCCSVLNMYADMKQLLITLFCNSVCHKSHKYLFESMCRSNLASGSRTRGGGQKPAQVREKQEPAAGTSEQSEQLFQHH